MKRIIYRSFGIIFLSNAKIFGESNTIVGNRCKIFGSRNKVWGDCNTVCGSSNEVYGNRSFIEGTSNKVIGSKNKIVGNWNYCNGEKNETIGNNNTISGTDLYIKGFGNWVNDKRFSNFMNGTITRKKNKCLLLKSDDIKEDHEIILPIDFNFKDEMIGSELNVNINQISFEDQKFKMYVSMS